MRFYNTFSRFFGLFCDFKFPHALQVMINKAYIKYFNIDMSEFKKVDEYSSLNSLFTRSLVCTRHICSDKNIVLSPSDGLCLEIGESDNENVLCIKGKHYNILELLNQAKLDEDIKFTNDKSCEYTGNNQSLVKNEFIPNFPINYVNIYLSPQDYHHYHSPCDMKICAAKYIPGELKSVSKSWLKKYPSLYTTNERVILSCKSEYRRFWMVFVGALNVGRMKFDFDSTIQTNAKFGKEFTKKYDSLEIKMGEHLGNFELGSTIVLIFEGEVLDFKISPNEKIKFSQIIATFK